MLAAIAMALGPPGASASPRLKYDAICLDSLIRTIVLEDDVSEVAKRPAPHDPDMHAFYLPGAKPCTFDGGYAPAGGPPKAISLYLAYRENRGQALYCPQPFAPVRIYVAEAATGCRPVAAPSANACALKAFTGDGDAKIAISQDTDQVTDGEFVAFLRDYIPANPHEFPGFSECLRH